jgi:hypothetical protein
MRVYLKNTGNTAVEVPIERRGDEYISDSRDHSELVQTSIGE